MAKDRGEKVPFREAAPIPKMQPVKGGDTAKKGTPNPRMQPRPANQPQSDGGLSNNKQLGRIDSGKKK